MFAAILLVTACDDDSSDNHGNSTNVSSVCAEITCSEHGKCAVTQDETAICICDNGYHTDPQDSTKCVIDTESPKACKDINCGGHGKCAVTQEGTAGCLCDNGYQTDPSNAANCVVDNEMSCTKDVCKTEQDGLDYMYKCKENKLVKDAPCKNAAGDPLSCNNLRTACGVCQNGTKTCTDQENIGEIKVCKNGEFVDNYSCESVSCNEQKCGECKNNDNKCQTDPADGYSKLYKCTNGKLSQNGTVCKKNTSDVSCNINNDGCGECKNGTVICEDEEETHFGRIKTCKNGKYEIRYCDNDYSCDIDNKKCGICRNDAVTCVNDKMAGVTVGLIYQCNNGVYAYTDEKCLNNAPCEVENVINYENVECSKCAHGTNKCQDDKNGVGEVYTCSDGSWGTDTTVCTIDGHEVSCKYGGKDCGECKNGDIKCINDNNAIGVIQTCKQGVYSKLSCDNVSCNDNKCGECINGTSCKNGKDGIGTLTTCVNGIRTETKCGDGTASCNADGTGCAS